MKKWTKLSSNVIHENPRIKVRKNAYELPNGKTMPDYYVVSHNNWANVIAVTPNKKILMVRQYRAGADVITLELPGGNIEPGEDVEVGALREFREETGFRANETADYKTHFPNPASQDNLVHTLYVPRCEAFGEPDPDEHEELELVELGFLELKQAIETGEIRHSVMLGALLLFWDRLARDLVQ